MASPKGGQAIDQGIISRLAMGVRFALSGKTVGEYFGPGQPLAPAAQEQTHGRAFDFPVNFNTTTRPRSDERIDFPTLRALADNYDLVRLAIETRKDQMGKLRWSVTRKDTGEQDATAQAIEEFLQEPDGEHDFVDWSRMLLEDLLVIDAPAVYIRPNLGAGVYALEQIDGATIKRVIDGRGRTPMAPEPAYQQVIKGLPVTDYHRDELIYKPRNPRVHKVYGFSPVEQLLLIVNIGLRRQAHQLAFYTAGNIPEMLLATPATWNPDQIAKFQKLWDMMMTGDLEARRQLKFVPGDIKPVPLRPEASLFDAFDEWLARVVCYCFSLPPNAFVKQQNRATAESAQDAALEEGLAPLMEWKVSLMNRLIRKGWKTNDYVFTWLDEQDVDPLVQAQVDEIYVRNNIRLPNEVRDDHGWEKRPELDELALALAPPTPPPGATPEPVDTEKVADKAAEKATAAIRAEFERAQLAAAQATQEVAERATAQRERLEKIDDRLGAIAEMRSMIEALEKKAPEKPIPTAQQLADALASMVESGVPLNMALKAAGYDFQVPGGDTALVNAKLVPLAMAAALGEEPAPQPIPVEKSAPAPAAIAPAPDVNVNVTLEQKGSGARTITLIKANGETITGDVKQNGSKKTITMVKPNGETISADITEEN